MTRLCALERCVPSDELCCSPSPPSWAIGLEAQVSRVDNGRLIVLSAARHPTSRAADRHLSCERLGRPSIGGKSSAPLPLALGTDEPPGGGRWAAGHPRVQLGGTGHWSSRRPRKPLQFLGTVASPAPEPCRPHEPKPWQKRSRPFGSLCVG